MALTGGTDSRAALRMMSDVRGLEVLADMGMRMGLRTLSCGW